MRELFVGFSVELLMADSNFPLMKTAGTPWDIQGGIYSIGNASSLNPRLRSTQQLPGQ